MATIRQTGETYVYDDNGFEIPLNQSSYLGFEHRLGKFVMVDTVMIEDPRDQQQFMHSRLNQLPHVFEQMLALARKVGTYVLRDEPFDYVLEAFKQQNPNVTDDLLEMYAHDTSNIEADLDKLLGGGDV
jgi:hypothetical protein